MPNTKSIQNAEPRSTEGSRVGVEQPLSQKTRGASITAPRKAGRPKGSKNKPKGLIPTELASAMLLQMQDTLPPEHFEYMRGVVKEGKAISTRQEMSILILLLSRNLYPALVMESLSGSEPETSASEFFEDPLAEDGGYEVPKKETGPKMPTFRKDVTERLKVLQGLLASYERMERGDKDADTKQDVILQVTARRGLDSGRVSALIGVLPGAMAGNADEPNGQAYVVGDVSDQDSQRPLLLPSSVEGEADRG